MNTCVRSHVLKYSQKSLWEWSPPSWIRTNPLLMPHISQDKSKKTRESPTYWGLKDCQFGDKAPLKPHMSRGGGGGGSGFTMTGALRLQSCFMHIFLIWTKAPLIQEVSGVYTSKKSFQGFREKGCLLRNGLLYRDRCCSFLSFLAFFCHPIHTLSSITPAAQTIFVSVFRT